MATKSSATGKLFSLKNNHATTKEHQGSFNYTEKYVIDEVGAEMGSESRFYKTFVDECGFFDMERMEAWRDALDVLLVFVGLFSAIVATFVVQTSQTLQPDYGQLTATMLYNLILIQQSLENHASPTLAVPNPADAHANPSGIDLWVNGLWFTSLAISLSTALLTVLTKQWLYHYMSQMSGTPQERARLRQFRFIGLEKYRVPMVIDLLPVALHMALALFLVGLALFLSQLNPTMTVIVSIIFGLTYVAYIISAILPLFDPQCPYRSPISIYLHHIKSGILAVWRALQKHVLRNRLQRLQRKREQMLLPFKGRAPREMYMPSTLETRLLERISLPCPPSSLLPYERQAVTLGANQLDIDAIAWLFSTSTNSTVRDISFQALAGLRPSAADSSRLRMGIKSYYDKALASMSDAGWVQPGREADYLALMYSGCILGLPMVWIRFTLEGATVAQKQANRLFFDGILPALAIDPSSFCLSRCLQAGDLSHLRLPHSAWAAGVVTCNSLVDHEVVSLFVTFINLRIGLPFMESYPEDPKTLFEALADSPYLYSLVLDVFTSRIGIPRDRVHSLHSIPLVTSYQTRILSQQPSEMTIPSKLSHMTALFSACDILGQLDRSGQEDRQLVINSCERYLAHPISLDTTEPHAAWDAYFGAVNLLYKILTPGLPYPFYLVSYLYKHLAHHAPSGTTAADIQQSTRAIQAIFASTHDVPAALDDIRTYDMLPIELMTSDGDGAGLSAFWNTEMCHFAVLEGRHKEVKEVNEKYLRRWITYIDHPQRLLFLFKKLLHGGHHWLVLERVSPLLELTKDSANWEQIFPLLIGLFQDDDYIKSFHKCCNTRQQLFDLLKHMQDNLPYLSWFTIPCYDGSPESPISEHARALVAQLHASAIIHVQRPLLDIPEEDEATHILASTHEFQTVVQRSFDGDALDPTTVLPLRQWQASASNRSPRQVEEGIEL